MNEGITSALCFEVYNENTTWNILRCVVALPRHSACHILPLSEVMHVSDATESSKDLWSSANLVRMEHRQVPETYKHQFKHVLTLTCVAAPRKEDTADADHLCCLTLSGDHVNE